MKLSQLSTALLAGLVISATLPATTASADESNDSPFKSRKKPPPPKPKTRSWTVNVKAEHEFSYLFDFDPGIATQDDVTEIFITINQIPKKADVRFGKNVPQQNAKVILKLIDPSGKTVGRYRAHPVPLSRGKYGVHMTPTKDGIHTLRLTGTTDKGLSLSSEVKLPVNVWPLPPELQGTGDAPTRARRYPIKL